MASYNPENILDALTSSGDGGNASVYFGSADVSSVLAADDAVRPCRVAGGTKVTRVVVQNDELDTGGTPTLAAKIGFTPLDGSAQASGDDEAVAAVGATILQDAATTTYEIFPPFLVEQDAYLEIVVTADPATGATGSVYAKVEGEAIGVK
jgi:hypothetical protein